jgi:hypothetical protein
LTIFTISFELDKERDDQEMELSCYYDEEIGEVVLLKNNGRKWKFPIHASTSVFKDVKISITCRNASDDDDFLKLFKNYDPSKMTIRTAEKKIQFFSRNYYISGEELKIIKCGKEYAIKIAKEGAYDEFIYLDSYYDTQEEFFVLLLKTKGKKYKVPFANYHIYNIKISVKSYKG